MSRASADGSAGLIGALVGMVGGSAVGVEPGAATIGGAVVGVTLAERLEEIGEIVASDPADDPAAAARRAYVDGRIDEEELEQRLALAVDPDADRLRAHVEEIDGIDTATSAALAEEFGTIDAVADADHDALVSVENVGDVRAEQIAEHVE